MTLSMGFNILSFELPQKLDTNLLCGFGVVHHFFTKNYGT